MSNLEYYHPKILEVLGQKKESGDLLGLIQRYELAEALTLVTKMTASDSGNHVLFYFKCLVYVLYSDFNSAITNINHALNLCTDPVLQAHYRARMVDITIAKNLSVVEETNDPLLMEVLDETSSANYHYARAVSLSYSDNVLEAVEELNTTLALDAEHVEAIILKGKLKLALEVDSEAKELFWRAHSIDPKHPEIKEFVNQMRPKALECYEKALKSYFAKDYALTRTRIQEGLYYYENYPKLMILLASIEREEGNYEKALKCLEDSSHHMKSEDCEQEIRSQIASTYNLMGQNLYLSRRYLDAITVFNEGIYYKPEEFSLYVNRGDCYLEIDKSNSAETDYLKALQLKAKDVMILGRLSMVSGYKALKYKNEGRVEEALLYYSKAIELLPSEVKWYVQRAKLFYEMNRHPESKQDFLRALQLDNNNEEVIRYLRIIDPIK